MTAIADRDGFIRTHTELICPPLVPELRLHLAHEAIPIWQKTEEELGGMGLPPPFWAFAWAGGQALARHVLDDPAIVQGKAGIDLASGSGLVAIAAMKAGAVSMLAADIDAFAAAAVRLNAEANGVTLAVTAEDLLGRSPPDADFLLIGDLFYERELAARVLSWAALAAARGTRVLVGDPGRAYFPKNRFRKLAEYQVPVTRELEDCEIKRTSVWEIG